MELMELASALRRCLEDYQGEGVIVMFALPEKFAQKIAIKGGQGPEGLHVTVCYVGKAKDLGKGKIKMIGKICKHVARSFEPLSARLGGLGRFAAAKTSDNKDVVYASVDAPRLEELRGALLRLLKGANIEWATDHGYSPHITLAYIDPSDPLPVSRIAAKQFKLDKLVFAVGSDRKEFSLTGRKLLTGEV